MAFNDNSVFPSTDELAVYASADHIYENMRDYVQAHEPIGISDVPGLFASLPLNSVYKVILYLFKDGFDLRSVLDKLKDVLWALERDNNLIGGK